jgi:hypothetical protein
MTEVIKNGKSEESSLSAATAARSSTLKKAEEHEQNCAERK